jgi:hypothetical protein
MPNDARGTLYVAKQKGWGLILRQYLNSPLMRLTKTAINLGQDRHCFGQDLNWVPAECDAGGVTITR